MRTAIYGAGSLGTVLGAYITKAGKQVDLINRNKTHIEGLKANGAHIIGTVDFTTPVSALLPEEMTGKYDIIFLMTKQLDNQKTVKSLAPFLADDGVICTTQNGMPELSVSEVIGDARTYGCTIAWGATLHGDGVSELTSQPDGLSFGLGSMSGTNYDDPHFKEIIALLQTMGTVEVEENFIGARWSKILINSAFSGLSAVLGTTFGGVFKPKRSRLIAQRIIKECIDTAKAAGIKIEPIQGKNVVALLDYNNPLKQKFSFWIIPIAMKKHSLLIASMLQDLQKGKKCEIEAINGVVSLYGRKYGVPTPNNDKVIEIVHEIEDGKAKPCFDNIDRFY